MDKFNMDLLADVSPVNVRSRLNEKYMNLRFTSSSPPPPIPKPFPRFKRSFSAFDIRPTRVAIPEYISMVNIALELDKPTEQMKTDEIDIKEMKWKIVQQIMRDVQHEMENDSLYKGLFPADDSPPTTGVGCTFCKIPFCEFPFCDKKKQNEE